MFCSWCGVCWSGPVASHRSSGKTERARTHMHWQTLTHTHTRIHAPPWTWWDFSLGVIIWNRGEWSVSTMHVCVWKSRVEVWRAVSLLRWGRLSLMNPPGLRVLLLTAANFTWHCWAAAEHGLATNRHASVSIRKEMPPFWWSRARSRTDMNTLYRVRAAIRVPTSPVPKESTWSWPGGRFLLSLPPPDL